MEVGPNDPTLDYWHFSDAEGRLYHRDSVTLEWWDYTALHDLIERHGLEQVQFKNREIMALFEALQLGVASPTGLKKELAGFARELGQVFRSFKKYPFDYDIGRRV